jgi:hypothetical protein
MMMTYLLVNYLKNQPFFVKFVSMITPQKIAIVGSNPQLLFLKLKLLDDRKQEEKKPLEIYQFGREIHDDQLIDQKMPATLLKQLLQKLNPHSIYLKESCAPHIIYNELDYQLNQKLGLKRVQFDIDRVDQALGKTNIHTKAQILSCGTMLASKTYPGFDVLLTTEDLEPNPRVVKAVKYG